MSIQQKIEVNQIYLDRYQCQRFKVQYFDAGEITLRADRVLSSKDYDRHHRDILEPLSCQLVTLSRMESDSPGWFNLSEET